MLVDGEEGLECGWMNGVSKRRQGIGWVDKYMAEGGVYQAGQGVFCLACSVRIKHSVGVFARVYNTVFYSVSLLVSSLLVGNQGNCDSCVCFLFTLCSLDSLHDS